jgi:hypothetical protein
MEGALMSTLHIDLETRSAAVSGLVEWLRFAGAEAETASFALKMREAADALLAQAERGDEYERLYRQAHLDYVTAEYKVEASDRQRDEALAALKASEEALRPFARFAEVYETDHVRRSGGRPENYDLSDAASVATGGRRDTETYRVLVVADLRRARSVTAQGSRPELADATNNPSSDPGTEQREAGV